MIDATVSFIEQNSELSYAGDFKKEQRKFLQIL